MESMQIIPTQAFDYINSSSPDVSVNPEIIPVTWLNTTSGEIYVCIDNTLNANIWRSSKIITYGTSNPPDPSTVPEGTIYFRHEV